MNEPTSYEEVADKFKRDTGHPLRRAWHGRLAQSGGDTRFKLGRQQQRIKQLEARIAELEGHPGEQDGPA